MSHKVRVAAAAVLATLSGVVWAESQFNASVAGIGDSENGRSFDFDAAFAPAHWWEVGAGVGSIKSDSSAGELDGTSYRAFADVHSDGGGLRGYYRKWNYDGYDTDTAGGRAYVRNGALTLSLIGEARSFAVDYNSGTVSNPQRSTASFHGTGWGAGASYARSGWGGSAEAVYYHYSSLSRFVTTQTTTGGTGGSVPGIPVVPVTPGSLLPGLPDLTQAITTVVPAFSGSYVTLNQGALAHLLTAGLERDFTRASVRLDWTGAKDAVLGINTNVYSAGFRYSFTERLSAGLTGGVSDSRFGSIEFAGLSFQINL